MNRPVVFALFAVLLLPAPLAAQPAQGEQDLSALVQNLTEQVAFLQREIVALRERVAALEAAASPAPPAPPETPAAPETPPPPEPPPAPVGPAPAPGPETPPPLLAGAWDLDVPALAEAIAADSLGRLKTVLSGATEAERAECEVTVRRNAAASAEESSVKLVLRADRAFTLTAAHPGLPARAEGSWSEEPGRVLLRAARVDGEEAVAEWTAEVRDGRLAFAAGRLLAVEVVLVRVP